MKATKVVEGVVVTEGDHQVASQVGLHLLGDLADRSGLTSAYSAAIPWTGERAPGQDRGRLFTQVAVSVAGGGVCVGDVAALRDQPDLFGEVASSPTIWRAFHEVDDKSLDALRGARATPGPRCGRRSGGLQRRSLTSTPPWSRSTRPTRSRPRLTTRAAMAFIPCSASPMPPGRPWAATLRPGNAAANSGADQLGVVDAAIASLPEARRAGHHAGDDSSEVIHRMVVRADSAGAVAALVDGLVERNVEFSVYARVNNHLSTAIEAVVPDAWAKAVTVDGSQRHAGEVAELDVELSGWPPGTRAIVRREKPHPGAQLRLWDTDGYRHQVTLTNSAGDALGLECRQRLHARVENSIKALRDTGLDRMPFTKFAANQAWLEMVLAGADLLAWLRLGCLDGELARAEPKSLPYRLLHAAARIVRQARRIILRLPEHWPWAAELAGAYRRLALLGI